MLAAGWSCWFFVLLPVLFWATPTAAIVGTVVGTAVTTAAAIVFDVSCLPIRPVASDSGAA